MSQKFLVDSFKWVEETSQYNEDFIKSNNDGSNIGYLIDVDVQYLEIFTTFAILPFFSERMKIGKAEKLVANLNDKKYILKKKKLKQALNHELVL